MQARIKKGDSVLVIAGKDKGKKSKVIKVILKEAKALVEKVNVVKKHQKPTKNFPGGIIDKILPFSLSKLMLICPHCGKPTRLKKKDGMRACVKCEQIIDKGK